MRYIFDENGTVCGYSTSTNGTSWSHYYFIRNLQGDVLQVFNSSNTIVAEYVYDSWGNILSAMGTSATENPFRYRGYHYDVETGFYYVSSRYYDPEVGRFINADGLVSTGQNIIGFNMFAYCLNNPIRLVDYSGMRQIVQHEYGHTVQLSNMGAALYTVNVAIPSLIGNRVAKAINR